MAGEPAEQGVRLRKLFRTLIYLPTLVPLVATAMIFKMVLAPSGPLNGALGVFGIPGPSWLLEAMWVKPALILLSVWGPARPPCCCSRQ